MQKKRKTLAYLQKKGATKKTSTRNAESPEKKEGRKEKKSLIKNPDHSGMNFERRVVSRKGAFTTVMTRRRGRSEKTVGSVGNSTEKSASKIGTKCAETSKKRSGETAKKTPPKERVVKQRGISKIKRNNGKTEVVKGGKLLRDLAVGFKRPLRGTVITIRRNSHNLWLRKCWMEEMEIRLQVQEREVGEKGGGHLRGKKTTRGSGDVE